MRVVRFQLVVLTLALAAGCASHTTRPIARPADGYDAIRFRSFTQVDDAGINTFAFAAGSVFVADRTEGGRKVYCGDATVNGGRNTLNVCIGVDGDRITVSPGHLVEATRTLPPGTIEHFKLEL